MFFVMILYVLILRYQMKSYFTYEFIVSLDEANELKDKIENFKITDAICDKYDSYVSKLHLVNS